MNNINILMIYNSSLNLENGSNTHVFELTKNMSKYFNLTLFAPKTGVCNQIDFIRYVPVISTKIDSIIYQLTYQVGLLIKLFNQCIIDKPDIIYERQCGWSFFPAIVAKIFNIPYIVELNGLLIDELVITDSPDIYIKISAFNERKNYNISSKIITVTQGIKNEIIKLYNVSSEKIVVINNGANINLFYPSNQKESQTKLNLAHSKNYICFVGSLAPWQGVEYLISASPIILKEYPSTLFLFVGDGVMKDELVLLTRELGVYDNFIFTGSVPYEMVPIYINAADICIVPKKPIKSGYSPLKLYEYMACGKPVIATNTNGFEILDEVEAGILVNSENPLELANSIIALLKNPKLMNEMGENGRRYVVEQHSWDSITKKVLNVCNDVISNSH